jgi:hypothetical protein
MKISSPSPGWVNSNLNPTSSTSFTITYYDAATISLTSSDISLVASGTAAASVADVEGTGSLRTVTLNSFSGVGTIKIQLAAGTASSTSASTVSLISNTFVVVNDATAPSAYSIGTRQGDINPTNINSLQLNIEGAEAGTTYDYTITSSGGGTQVQGSGAVPAGDPLYPSNPITFSLTNINVAGLADGIVTISLKLTDSTGNAGLPATVTLLKATEASWNVWQDVTTNDSGAASNCTADPTRCTLKTNTGLWWTKLQPNATGWNAFTNCASLSHNGQTGWRIPTLGEWLGTYDRTITSVASNNWIPLATMSESFLSSTPSCGSDPAFVWKIAPATAAMPYGGTNGCTTMTHKNFEVRVACVRNGSN